MNMPRTNVFDIRGCIDEGDHVVSDVPDEKAQFFTVYEQWGDDAGAKSGQWAALVDCVTRTDAEAVVERISDVRQRPLDEPTRGDHMTKSYDDNDLLPKLLKVAEAARVAVSAKERNGDLLGAIDDLDGVLSQIPHNPMPNDKIEGCTVIASCYYGGPDEDQWSVLLLHPEPPFFSCGTIIPGATQLEARGGRHSNIVVAVEDYTENFGGDY